MSFQTRIFVAVALCALIFIVFDFINPKPPPEELEEQAIAAADGEDAQPGGEAEGDAKAEAPQAEPEPEVDPTAEQVPEQVHEIRNDLLALTVTNASPGRGGLISGVHLLSSQFEGHLTATDSLALAGARTLEVTLTDDDGNLLVPRGASYEVREVDEDRITLAYVGKGVEVLERIELLGGYQARLEVEVVNRSGESITERVHVRTRIGQSESRYDIRRGLCRTAEDVEYEDKSDLEDGAVRYSGDIAWAGVDGKYFTTLLVPKRPAQDCELVLYDDDRPNEDKLIEAKLSSSAQSV
ncbi:MAG: membrane protein insertase YidC, partial [Nannocystaceae bacterium]